MRDHHEGGLKGLVVPALEPLLGDALQGHERTGHGFVLPVAKVAPEMIGRAGVLHEHPVIVLHHGADGNTMLHQLRREGETGTEQTATWRDLRVPRDAVQGVLVGEHASLWVDDGGDRGQHAIVVADLKQAGKDRRAPLILLRLLLDGRHGNVS